MPIFITVKVIRGVTDESVDSDVIVGIPLLIKAIILGIQNILEVLL